MSDVSRSERSERTRETLLATGLAILREQPADLIFDHLDARSVSSRAGVTTGAFYHHFDGADGYHEALLQYCLDVEVNRPFAVASAAFEERVNAGADFVSAFIPAAAEMMRWQETNHTFVLQVAVWARRARSVDVSRRLQRMYRRVQEELGVYYAAIIEALGREMRPPYEVRDIVSAFIALNEGLTLQRGVDPDGVAPERLGELCQPLILMMTRPLGDDSTLSGWIAEEAPGFGSQA